MRVLQVIHGYPPRFNAGSEVYTQNLAHGLARKGFQVEIFTREENPFIPDFQLRREPDLKNPKVVLNLVNNPRNRDRYREPEIDRQFEKVLDEFQPDIVHIQHLNHLSTSLVEKAAARELPIIYTLHDYWLLCPRGQFIQIYPENPAEPWAVCDGQENRKCAERCYARYFSGAPEERQRDLNYWEQWVAGRMNHIRQVLELVDFLIAPSNFLLELYKTALPIPSSKLLYLDYGFDLERLKGRKRKPGEPFTFGYIGTHIPAKGIDLLLKAFAEVEGEPLLRIWGRPRGFNTPALKELARRLPNSVSRRIEWRPEYENDKIVRDVFNYVDAIVVPSIWFENSPLVIHEAQQARVPVITANIGGMAEYVRHEVNGLLFEFRSWKSLAEQMSRFVRDPQFARQLGEQGYLFDREGNIPSIEEHVEKIEEIYRRALERRDSSHVTVMRGPWRITFDTNPDDCNLHCVMCEEHSLLSRRQRERREKGLPKRRMPFELIEKVIASAAPYGLREIIPSTMGEPLLYRDFEKIIELCKKYGVFLNLTTNGTFPRLGPEKWAELIVPVASDVKISWNGATKETQEKIMVGTKWETHLKNLKSFIEVRDRYASEGKNYCRITLQLTFMEDNFSELPEIVRLGIKLGVDRIKGHHLWVHTPEMEGQSMRRSPEAIERWNAVVREVEKIAEEFPLPNGKKILLDNIFPLQREAVEDLVPGGPCPFLGQEAWVSAEGRFDPCCAPDDLRRTLGYFGNLNQTDLMDIWNGKQYQMLVATYRNRSLCIKCNMRKPLEEESK